MVRHHDSTRPTRIERVPPRLRRDQYSGSVAALAIPAGLFVMSASQYRGYRIAQLTGQISTFLHAPTAVPRQQSAAKSRMEKRYRPWHIRALNLLNNEYPFFSLSSIEVPKVLELISPRMITCQSR